MVHFSKILIALDTTEITDYIEKKICDIVDKFTVVKITDDYSIPLCNFKNVLDELPENIEDKQLLSDKIYTTIEKHFDNYGDEIHDIMIDEFTQEKGSWNKHIILPTIFIRDHKQDNKFRNKFSSLFPRIIQFIINEKNTINPGEERTNKIFSMGVNQTLLITNDNEDNQYGIQYIGYKSQLESVPILTINNGVEEFIKFEKPILSEELHIFKKIDMESDEYKAKFRDSIKKLRKSYYDSIKSQNEMKLFEPIDKTSEKIKQKIPSKAMRKKAMKKKKEKIDNPNKISEVEILEESYD